MNIDAITVMHGHPLSDADAEGMQWVVGHPLYARLRGEGHHVLLVHGRIMWLEQDRPGRPAHLCSEVRIGDATGGLIHPADWSWDFFPAGAVELLAELEAAAEAAGVVDDVVWDRARYEAEVESLDCRS